MSSSERRVALSSGRPARLASSRTSARSLSGMTGRPSVGTLFMASRFEVGTVARDSGEAQVVALGPLEGVDADAVDADFPVEVGAGGEAGSADEGEGLTGHNLIAGFDEDDRGVPVKGVD